MATSVEGLTSPQRFQQAADSLDQGGTEGRLATERAALEACAFKLIARRREVRLELGRTFTRIKRTVNHGRWRNYFAETFGKDISIRSAERYMKLAAEADKGAKNDSLSHFISAEDAQAVKMRNATEKAMAELGGTPGRPISDKPTFKLPLLLTADDQRATRDLLKSAHWKTAQREIIALLKRLLIKFRVGRELTQ